MRHQLPDGYSVKFRHRRLRRYAARKFKFDDTITVDDTVVDNHLVVRTSLNPFGGATQAEVFDESGQLVAIGTAICRPDEHFVKAVGRQVALGRALKTIGA